MNFIKTCMLVYEKNIIPSFTTIFSHIYASISTFAPERPIRRNIDNIRIFWMNNDVTNMLRVFKPHIFPWSTTVNRFINPITVCNRSLIIIFTCTNPNYICIIGVYCNTTNRIRRLTIKYWCVINSPVWSFPNTSRGDSYVILKRIVRVNR